MNVRAISRSNARRHSDVIFANLRLRIFLAIKIRYCIFQEIAVGSHLYFWRNTSTRSITAMLQQRRNVNMYICKTAIEFCSTLCTQKQNLHHKRSAWLRLSVFCVSPIFVRVRFFFLQEHELPSLKFYMEIFRALHKQVKSSE